VSENASPHDSAPPNKRSSYARSKDTRARILEAALAEASESGFHKTSVAKIAARAGVAVGNLHYHFGSRRALLRELMMSLVSDLLSRLHVAYPNDNAEFFDHEREGLLVYLEYLRANPAYVRLADEVKLHDPELYRRAVAGWVDRYEVRLREAIASGVVRPLEDAAITAQAHFLLGVRHFLDPMMQGSVGRPYPGDEAVADAYLMLVRNGLQGARATDPKTRD
jgi:AcrR family transcriptional regulator